MAKAPEFDGQPMTKREVLIAREAYVRRARDDYNETGWVRYGNEVHAKAAKNYPLPKMTRPRVVADPHAWCVDRGAVSRVAVYWMAIGTGVHPCDCDGLLLVAPIPMASPTAKRIALWADLLARPTEEVDAD